MEDSSTRPSSQNGTYTQACASGWPLRGQTCSLHSEPGSEAHRHLKNLGLHHPWHRALGRLINARRLRAGQPVIEASLVITGHRPAGVIHRGARGTPLGLNELASLRFWWHPDDSALLSAAAAYGHEEGLMAVLNALVRPPLLPGPAEGSRTVSALCVAQHLEEASEELQRRHYPHASLLTQQWSRQLKQKTA